MLLVVPRDVAAALTSNSCRRAAAAVKRNQYTHVTAYIGMCVNDNAVVEDEEEGVYIEKNKLHLKYKLDGLYIIGKRANCIT